MSDLPHEVARLGVAGLLELAYPWVEVFRLTNVATSVPVWEIDPNELVDVTREQNEAERDVVAIDHSHPASPAWPSTTDLELAFWLDAWHLTRSLVTTGAP